MAETKEIMISLPDSLLKEVDFIVSIEKKNRSEFVKEAMRLYIRERKRLEVSQRLKAGYLEMSNINLSLAEVGFEQDVVELFMYETNLTGCGRM